MGGAHEVVEHMEHAGHAAHADHGHANPTGKYIGISMACLGVLLAFTSALVGAERTELVKTMVEQTNAHSKYQAQSIKYRVVVSQVQALASTIPSHADLSSLDAELVKLGAARPKEAEPALKAEPGKPVPKAVDGAVKEIAKPEAKAEPAVDSSTVIGATQILLRQMRLLSPQKDDVMRFVHLIHKYRKERDLAATWVDSFEPAVHAHAEASEHYEWAQLAAEIGIVVASIALIFTSRKVWGLSLGLGAAALGIIGWTYNGTHGEVHHAEQAIEQTGKAYHDLRKSQDEKGEDEKLMKDVAGLFGVALPADEPEPPAAKGHDAHGHGH